MNYLIIILLILSSVWISELGFSANASSPVSATVSDAIILKVDRQFSAATVALNRIHFSPNGQMLLTSSAAGVASLWSPTGDRLATMQGHKPPMFNARFSPMGQELITTGYDGTIRRWDTTGKLLAQKQAHRAAVTDIIITSEEKFIITSSDDGQTQIFSSTGDRLAGIIKPGTARNLAYSPQKNLIASAYDSGSLYLLTPDANITQEIATGQGRINNVNFDRTGEKIITAGTDGKAKLWQLNGQLITELKATSIGWVNGAAFAPNGQLIATAGDDGVLRLWTSGAELLQALPLGENNKLTSLSFSPEGSQIAVSSNKGQVWIVNIASR